MNLDRAVNIEDLHRIAKRKLPRIIFDYIEGGVEDERGIARNEAAFHKHRLLPRYLVDVSKRDQSATVFGHTYSSPFGISPTGSVGLYRREGEVMLAEAAAAANIPYIMSGAANASMEEAARVARDNLWFQLYAAKDPDVTDALIGRARDAGLGALVLTVDVPVHPKRERNYRNGFARVRGGRVWESLKLKPSVLLEAMIHPAWVVEYARLGGAPTLGNWAPHAGNGASKEQVIAFGRGQTPASAQTWRDLERYRRLFPRALVVKGILNPADAVRAAEIGVDGIIVSNHGGRQLDQAPASLEALPAIKAAVGEKVT
ncbi:MAG: alpha-hydroxy-acid oxidizing protein, partial [Alphaproteobacteria bacterium]|nr:alpha-hydroxy-acid oxidizing protein [Alphaproteobacteria bacterium]